MNGTYLHAPPLTPDDCELWACKEFWTVDEAVVLSIGYDPGRKGENLSDEEAAKLWMEYQARAEIVERSGYYGVAKDPPPFKPIHSRNEVVFAPHQFINWGKRHFPTFHEELFKAVKAKNGPTLCADNISETRGEGLHPKSLIDRRWAPKREMEAKARRFAVEALEMGCTCSHAELADYMHTDAFDDEGQLVFNHRRIKEQSMRNLLLKAVRSVFQKNAPNRVVGEGAYTKSKACVIHQR